MPTRKAAYRFTATEKQAIADGHTISPGVSRALRALGYSLKHLGGNVYNYARPWGEVYVVGFDGNPPARLSEPVVLVDDDHEREFASVTALVKAMGGKVARKATRKPARSNRPRRKPASKRTSRRR